MSVDRTELNKRIVDTIVKLRSFEVDGKPREQKITQEELATLVGVPRTTITNIENSRQLMPLHLFYDICLVLNVEARDMLPSMEELGQDLDITDSLDLVIEGTRLQSHFGDDVISLIRDRMSKAQEGSHGDESTNRQS